MCASGRKWLCPHLRCQHFTDPNTGHTHTVLGIPGSCRPGSPGLHVYSSFLERLSTEDKDEKDPWFDRDSRGQSVLLACLPVLSWVFTGTLWIRWGAGVSKSRLAREGRRECRCANPRPAHQSLGTREMTWQVFRWSRGPTRVAPSLPGRTDGQTGQEAVDEAPGSGEGVTCQAQDHVISVAALTDPHTGSGKQQRCGVSGLWRPEAQSPGISRATLPAGSGGDNVPGLVAHLGSLPPRSCCLLSVSPMKALGNGFGSPLPPPTPPPPHSTQQEALLSRSFISFPKDTFTGPGVAHGL